MKALIILLVIVGVSFVGLLVYGAGRDEQPKRACERLPTFEADEDPDEDAVKDWCPPDFAEKTRGLQALFPPKLGIDPVELASLPQSRTQFSVGRSDKKGRAARIELVAGSFAILNDNGKAKLCLCQPNSLMSDALFGETCPDSWKTDHLDPKNGPVRQCRDGDERGILAFKQEGGAVVLTAGPPATVRIQ